MPRPLPAALFSPAATLSSDQALFLVVLDGERDSRLPLRRLAAAP